MKHEKLRKKFKNWLLKNRKENKIRIFFDIETLQYNEVAGRVHPSDYKNVTYSVCIGYLDEKEIEYCIFPSFKDFFETIFETWDKWISLPSVEMIAHNNNKYDNHFLRKDLIYFYPEMQVKNMYLKNATEEGNKIAIKENQLHEKEMIEGIILEKRIKSSNNLELIFYKNGIKFYTVDNFMKTNVSIATLGKKLLRIGVISEDYLKTDYDYIKYNLEQDLEDENAYRYAHHVFQNLTDEELIYIRNDVIILGYSVLYYSKIFKGFDYDKITFTSNILEHYNNNELTNYQLLRKIGQGNKAMHIKYTDYRFNDINFYDHLKKFYSGGLNMYNTKYVGKIINNLFSIDINSSYPYVMHNFKVPTFYHSSKIFEKETEIRIGKHNDNFFKLYQMSRTKFDSEIVEKLNSRMLKQILVKYYGKHDDIYINSYTLKILEKIEGLKIEKLTIKSIVVFECFYFGSRKEIEEAYYIKTQGKLSNIVEFNSPYDIKVTEEPNLKQFSKEEVDNSKVILNGLYGIPALRPYFNLFRLVGDEIKNFENGYKNNERNIVFSIFVTSVALYNLLSPLHYMTPEEIDNNLIYMDTDSLYLKKDVFDNIPSDFYHDLHLGKWDIEHEQIDKMYVLNHKKYAILINEDNKKEIIIKCGGIPNESFNRNMSFERFIETQFSDGIEVKNTKSILNKQGTVSIYPSSTKLELGGGYPIFADDETIKKIRNSILDKAKKDFINGSEDIMYIESNIGTFSVSDLFPKKNKHDDKLPLEYLQLHEQINKKKLKLDN